MDSFTTGQATRMAVSYRYSLSLFSMEHHPEFHSDRPLHQDSNLHLFLWVVTILL